MKILDNGYVKLIECWGSDAGVVESARMSTGKGFKGWPGDEKLLRFLWKNKHTSPFEQGGATFEVQAPLFVIREWHRHRTQSYSEHSARYSQMPDLHYVPSVTRICKDGGTNKQAQGTSKLSSEEAIISWINDLKDLQEKIYQHYEEGLRLGIPKEISRINTPVSRYSKMRASANLLNWLRFLHLRQDSNAQWEIQQYANAISNLLSLSFPRTMNIVRQEGW